MTLKETISKLAALGSEKLRLQNSRRGVGKNQYGVMMGQIRKLAKEIKTNHRLALELWDSENYEARLLAILIMQAKQLSAKQLDAMVKSNSETWVADWLDSYVIKEHPDKEKLRQKWMASKHPMAARAGWSLTASRIAKDADGLELEALLKRIEKEMPNAPKATQWTMNTSLAYIGIHHSGLRAKALAIGEKMGIYRDYPVSPGCTSPFAPIWINEMVRRKSK